MPNIKTPLKHQIKIQEDYMSQAFSKWSLENVSREIPDSIIGAMITYSNNKPFKDSHEAYDQLVKIIKLYDRTKATLKVVDAVDEATK